MNHFGTFGDVDVDLGDDFVATAEIRRPPHNFFDVTLIRNLCESFEALDGEPSCRVIVLCSQGKNFCAGAELARRRNEAEQPSGSPDASARAPERHLYDEAVRLFSTQTPVVAAIQGAAIGGGLGLALMADFRIAAGQARFSANFARLGFHHGFGLSVTLPEVIGRQRAMELLYSGKRIDGEEALALGLCDRLAPLAELRERTREFAREIARSAPLAVLSIRQTLRGDLPERIRRATDREKAEQDRLRQTNDFKEGVRAMADRRIPSFTGS